MKRSLIALTVPLLCCCPSSSFVPPPPTCARRIVSPSRSSECNLQAWADIVQHAPTLMASSVVPVKVLSVSTGIFGLVRYHRNLQKREEDGQSTWRTSQAETREEWSKFVRKTEGWLYAVQTLRNAITANTFLATTVLSLLTVVTGKLWTTTLTEGTMYQRIQFSTVAMSLLRSAYEFLQSARLMTHAGFMFPVTSDGTKVDNIMRKSSITQWLGLRWLYIGGTMMVWTIGGEITFLVASLIVLRFFRSIDQVPESYHAPFAGMSI